MAVLERAVLLSHVAHYKDLFGRGVEFLLARTGLHGPRFRLRSGNQDYSGLADVQKQRLRVPILSSISCSIEQFHTCLMIGGP
jgi:hypothetical protein